MEKKIARILVLLIVFLLISVSVFYFLTAKKSTRKFEQFKNGVLFTSDTNEPIELLKNFSKKETFFISPQLTMENSTLNSEISNNFFLPAIVVIAGNDKNAVTLGRVYSDSMLLVCETNMGNPKTRISITKEDCLSFLKEKDAVAILVDFPSESNALDEVFVGENFVEIKAKSFASLNLMTIALLEEMFPNARKVIDSSNERVGGLGFG